MSIIGVQLSCCIHGASFYAGCGPCGRAGQTYSWTVNEHPINVERLARALHGSGFDLSVPSDEWGTCVNWEPGLGVACGPEKHMDEARRIAARYARQPR